MKKLFALLAVFALAFSFGVFADNHETGTGSSMTGDVMIQGTGEVMVETGTGEVMEGTGEVMEEEMEEGELISAEVVRSESGLVALNVQDAIDYLYANGLTMFATEETFMGTSSLRRDEAAAFFARFARDVLKMEVNADAEGCEFSDLAGAHQDLLGEVAAACQLGLMKGSEGMFMPTATLTNAQAMTVLVRLLIGDQEEAAGNWAANYYAAAQTAGLTVSLDADAEANLHVAITRADVAKMIEASAAYIKIGTIDGESEVSGEVETETEVVVETGTGSAQ